MPGDERDILTTTTLDSGLETNTVGMSSTFLSNTALQSELNECRQRERKLEEKNHLLKHVRKISHRTVCVFSLKNSSNMFSQQLQSSIAKADEVNNRNQRKQNKNHKHPPFCFLPNRQSHN